MLTGFALTGTALSDELGQSVPSRTTRLLCLVKPRRDLRRRSRWEQPRFRGRQRRRLLFRDTLGQARARPESAGSTNEQHSRGGSGTAPGFRFRACDARSHALSKHARLEAWLMS